MFQVVSEKSAGNYVSQVCPWTYSYIKKEEAHFIGIESFRVSKNVAPSLNINLNSEKIQLRDQLRLSQTRPLRCLSLEISQRLNQTPPLRSHGPKGHS